MLLLSPGLITFPFVPPECYFVFVQSICFKRNVIPSNKGAFSISYKSFFRFLQILPLAPTWLLCITPRRNCPHMSIITDSLKMVSHSFCKNKKPAPISPITFKLNGLLLVIDFFCVLPLEIANLVVRRADQNANIMICNKHLLQASNYRSFL